MTSEGSGTSLYYCSLTFSLAKNPAGLGEMVESLSHKNLLPCLNPRKTVVGWMCGVLGTAMELNYWMWEILSLVYPLIL